MDRHNLVLAFNTMVEYLVSNCMCKANYKLIK